jgi:adenylate cyclase
MRDELRRLLREQGSSEADLARAEEFGFVPLLALEARLLPGERKYDVAQLALAAGIDEAWAQRLWRAVGFPDVPPGVAAFTERDVAAAREVVREATEWRTDPDTLLEQVRVTSSAAMRIAAVEAEVIADFVQRKRSDGVAEDDIALEFLGGDRLERLALLVDYLLRIQLRAAVWRRLALQADPDIAIAVGFADLAGYTELSGGLDPEELSKLLSRWEAVAYDTVVADGARVVKSIGDEVMFVGLPHEVLASALALREAVRAEGLPPVRAGVAAGPVIPREGDFYGPVVNLASRLTAIAPANKVLVPAAIRSVVAEGDFRFVPMGEQFLRGIGNVETCAVEDTG